MSDPSDPWPKIQPGDIFDDSSNINKELVEPHRDKKGWGETKDQPVWVCNSCNWQYVLKLNKCPHCGSPSRRRVKAHALIKGLGEKRDTAHYVRPIVYCWNIEELPNGDIQRHKLVPDSRLVVNLETKEAHKEGYCRTCGMAFNRFEGRMATEQELEQARQGKIPAPAGLDNIMGAEMAR